VSDVPINGPGFIQIIVSDVPKSAAFYEEHCGAVRDPFFVKHGNASESVAYYGWPAFAIRALRPGEPMPSAPAQTIFVWFRSSDVQATHDRAKAAGVRIVREPWDSPFGRQFTMADPDGYKVTIYEKDQPLYWPPKV
jgi:predicted enzyme related to lactoylglutathione lyase